MTTRISPLEPTQARNSSLRVLFYLMNAMKLSSHEAVELAQTIAAHLEADHGFVESGLVSHEAPRYWYSFFDTYIVRAYFVDIAPENVDTILSLQFIVYPTQLNLYPFSQTIKDSIIIGYENPNFMKIIDKMIHLHKEASKHKPFSPEWYDYRKDCYRIKE